MVGDISMLETEVATGTRLDDGTSLVVSAMSLVIVVGMNSGVEIAELDCKGDNVEIMSLVKSTMVVVGTTSDDTTIPDVKVIIGLDVLRVVGLNSTISEVMINEDIGDVTDEGVSSIVLSLVIVENTSVLDVKVTIVGIADNKTVVVISVVSVGNTEVNKGVVLANSLTRVLGTVGIISELVVTTTPRLDIIEGSVNMLI